MNFEKKVYLKLLKKTKFSSGEFFLSKGRIVLKVKDALNTRILFDKNQLWYITSPPKEKEQIVRRDIKNSDQNKLLLSFLFRPDFLFQEFRFVSARSKGRTWILDFEPVRKGSEIKSFSVKVDGKLILKIGIKWDSLGNEEEYTFSDIRFNQNIPARYFQVKGK